MYNQTIQSTKCKICGNTITKIDIITADGNLCKLCLVKSIP